MENKASILHSKLYSSPKAVLTLKDDLGETFAIYLKNHIIQHHASMRVSLPTRTSVAFFNDFDLFEGQFLTHSEYVIIIITRASIDCVKPFYARLMVFLTKRQHWTNRFIILVVGEIDMDECVHFDDLFHDLIYFPEYGYEKADIIWQNLFSLIKMEWTPIAEEELIERRQSRAHSRMSVVEMNAGKIILPSATTSDVTSKHDKHSLHKTSGKNAAGTKVNNRLETLYSLADDASFDESRKLGDTNVDNTRSLGVSPSRKSGLSQITAANFDTGTKNILVDEDQLDNKEDINFISSHNVKSGYLFSDFVNSVQHNNSLNISLVKVDDNDTKSNSNAQIDFIPTNVTTDAYFGHNYNNGKVDDSNTLNRELIFHQDHNNGVNDGNILTSTNLDTLQTGSHKLLYDVNFSEHNNAKDKILAEIQMSDQKHDDKGILELSSTQASFKSPFYDNNNINLKLDEKHSKLHVHLKANDDMSKLHDIPATFTSINESESESQVMLNGTKSKLIKQGVGTSLFNLPHLNSNDKTTGLHLNNTSQTAHLHLGHQDLSNLDTSTNGENNLLLKLGKPSDARWKQSLKTKATDVENDDQTFSNEYADTPSNSSLNSSVPDNLSVDSSTKTKSFFAKFSPWNNSNQKDHVIDKDVSNESNFCSSSEKLEIETAKEIDLQDGGASNVFEKSSKYNSGVIAHNSEVSDTPLNTTSQKSLFSNLYDRFRKDKTEILPSLSMSSSETFVHSTFKNNLHQANTFNTSYDSVFQEDDTSQLNGTVKKTWWPFWTNVSEVSESQLNVVPANRQWWFLPFRNGTEDTTTLQNNGISVKRFWWFLPGQNSAQVATTQLHSDLVQSERRPEWFTLFRRNAQNSNLLQSGDAPLKRKWWWFSSNDVNETSAMQPGFEPAKRKWWWFSRNVANETFEEPLDFTPTSRRKWWWFMFRKNDQNAIAMQPSDTISERRSWRLWFMRDGSQVTENAGYIARLKISTLGCYQKFLMSIRKLFLTDSQIYIMEVLYGVRKSAANHIAKVLFWSLISGIYDFTIIISDKQFTPVILTATTIGVPNKTRILLTSIPIPLPRIWINPVINNTVQLAHSVSSLNYKIKLQ